MLGKKHFPTLKMHIIYSATQDIYFSMTTQFILFLKVMAYSNSYLVFMVCAVLFSWTGQDVWNCS